jgi:uncharacterized membrane protein
VAVAAQQTVPVTAIMGQVVVLAAVARIKVMLEEPEHLDRVVTAAVLLMLAHIEVAAAAVKGLLVLQAEVGTAMVAMGQHHQLVAQA